MSWMVGSENIVTKDLKCVIKENFSNDSMEIEFSRSLQKLMLEKGITNDKMIEFSMEVKQLFQLYFKEVIIR